MTNTVGMELLPVEQCDREAMVEYENGAPIGLNPKFAERVLAGLCDDDRRVQAFARYRVKVIRAKALSDLAEGDAELIGDPKAG